MEKGLSFMNRKVFWLAFILVILVLFFLSLIITMNRVTTKTNKTILDKETYIHKDTVTKRDIEPSKKRFDVFKPKTKKIKRQQERSQRGLGYEIKGEEHLLI